MANYLAKGGKIEDTVGRKCLCNALLANIGHAQTRKDGTVEPALVTVGDDLNSIAQFLTPGRSSYSAADVVESLLSLVPAAVRAGGATRRAGACGYGIEKNSRYASSSSASTSPSRSSLRSHWVR